MLRMLSLLIGLALAAIPLRADAPRVPTPKEHFGFKLGDDYCLANYEQYAAYLEKLQKQSDRIKVVNIGNTEERRPQLMAIVTSPANHRNLDRCRAISRSLARAEGISSEEATKLAREGKAIVWIDGGLHANEVLCAQALAEMIHRLASADDAETLRILDDVVILLVHANPDGMDLCADWYMRERDPAKRTLSTVPRLYQKYAGHDNNRDFYANTQAETRNMNRVMFREWYPQIVHDQHQPAPAGSVLFCPPFRDPFNFNIDPLVVAGINSVGAAMMHRFLEEDKPGVTTRGGAMYTGWWNGSLRSTCYFHNMIGILTETTGHPAPVRIPFLPAMQVAKGDLPVPIPPQEWRFRQSLEYSVTANMAILAYAAKNRESLLRNIWQMGKAAIDRGNRDSWTVTPKVAGSVPRDAFGPGSYQKYFRNPANRDARGYVIPADQADFPTATKFVNALIGAGATVHRAQAEFTIAGRKYPGGSYVVKSAQPFRAHVLDMFEPQDHPDVFLFPGAAPTPPYDLAGYTLAFQMGVKFDRVLEGFDGPFEELKEETPPPPAKVAGDEAAAGYLLQTRTNDAFRAINQLLAAGEDVRRLTQPLPVDGGELQAGTFFVTNRKGTRERLEKIAKHLGTPFVSATQVPEKGSVPLKTPRVALWDRFGGSIASGWTRWVMEQFDYSFKVVFPPELDQGELRKNYDVIVLPDGAIGRANSAEQPAPPLGLIDELGLPAEYRGRRGFISGKTITQLKKFVEDGGTVLAFGSSTAVSGNLGLPIANHLAKGPEQEKPLGFDKFYIPPSILRAKVDPRHPLAWGLDGEVDLMFTSSPVFRAPTGGWSAGLSRVVWYSGKQSLRSGWAFGQEYLDGGVAVQDAQVGRGRLVCYGSPVLFRAQSHGTFKLFFNALLRAGEKQ